MNRTARVLAALLATAVVGIAIYAAYQSGFDQGAVTAAASAPSGDNSETVVVVPGAGFSGAYRWHGGFGFFPFFPILFFVLIFGIFRAGRWGGGPYRHSGGGGWGPPKEFIDERMTEWHKQAHNQDDANRPGG